MLFFVATLAPDAAAAWAYSANVEFRLVGYDANQLSTLLRFENGTHDWRTIVLMDKDRQVAETTPRAEGLLDWKYVTAIRLKPVDADPKLKCATIEFIDKYDQRHKKFELGLIDIEHLRELEHRYGKFLKFRTS
jgi:hypothetical protein